MLALRIQQFDKLFKLLSMKTLSEPRKCQKIFELFWSENFVLCDDQWHNFKVFVKFDY